MDGIILIDKPIGPTSHKIVEFVRKKLKIRKVGHAGTLDPIATGLLIIMIGKSTKISSLLTSQFKSYQVEMKLFKETNTGDITGKIIKTEEEKIFEIKDVLQAIDYFNNYTYLQDPPLYSAIKIKGKKLYQYALKGINVNVPPRSVTIRSINFLNYNKEKNIINFSTNCSKGTYIRSLVIDIAKRLKTIATVSQLRRISIGNFHIKDAIKLDEVCEKKIIKDYLI